MGFANRASRTAVAVVLASLTAVSCARSAGRSGTVITRPSPSPSPSASPSPSPSASPSSTPSPVPSGNFPFAVWNPSIPVTAPSTTGSTYYVDAKNGNNSNSGKTAALPFKTIAKAISIITAGDTVLIKGGLYREGISITGSPQGAPGKPITFGSFGDSEVILDGSTAITGWTLHSGTVWKAPINFRPQGLVLNDVPLRQVRQAGYTTAPSEGLAGVTSGSGKWYYDSANKLIYGDMGTANPNTADIVVPNSDGAQTHVYFYDSSYFTLNGLTIRGSGSNGMWTYGGSSHITVQNCNFKFNGKGGLTFNGGVDNQALYNHVFHNVLANWPRGNNQNAESGGGWPGALGWSSEVRPVARGNLVHMNGGEGIITYGDTLFKGEEPGQAVFEQNVSYDNWSMNMYVDNQPYAIVRNNLLYRNLPAASDFIYVGSGYPWSDVLEKYRTCLSISDEFGSSRDGDGIARNHDIQVTNNLIAGCRIGILDYGESVKGHGLRNATIANNTIIMDSHAYTSTWAAGIYLADNDDPSNYSAAICTPHCNSGSVVQNNIIHANGSQDPLLWSYPIGVNSGVTFKNNVYYSAKSTPFYVGNNNGMQTVNFANWKSSQGGQDSGSLFADPLFINIGQFGTLPNSTFGYTNAMLQSGSPAQGAGAY